MVTRFRIYGINFTRIYLLSALLSACMALCAVGQEVSLAGNAAGEVPDSTAEAADESTAAEPAPAPNRAIARYNQGRASFIRSENSPGEETPSRVGAGGFAIQAVIYLGILAAAFWCMLYAFKKFVPGGKQLFSSPSMEVLGRTHLDPRRYMALVRVGRKVLVVAVSPDGITPLSEITEGEDVAEIMQESRPRTESGENLFHRLFTRHVAEAEQDQDLAETEAAADELQTTLSELRQRVHSLGSWEGP